MTKTTKAEKEYIQQWLNRYVNGGQPPTLTIKQYARLASWLSGLTYAEIAAEERVTAQAVARSVKRDLSQVLEFAKANDKDYDNNINGKEHDNDNQS